MFYENSQHQDIDRLVRASLAGLTMGISPSSVMLTYLDWLSSLALSPGTQAHLLQKALKKQLRLLSWASHSAFDRNAPPCIIPLPQDRRFRDPSLRVDDHPVALSDIQVPIFCVGTEWDHVAPWRSTYRLHLLSDAPEITFLLTSGGHNAGIISPPEHPHRHYRITVAHEKDSYIDPDTWLESTTIQPGSWWEEWQIWLEKRSGPLVRKPTLGSNDYPPLEDAPGSYVKQP
ncbi:MULTISPECIES: poly-beta-hydroxybutyrate polymerase N-terminal domain-containing protein [unclassified Halomonas]|uniref:poly-beta-hydroxybutyrate polymerase N-terminal domain-containing protein n=1 Tax=unclassified Halomonas TaxID=2609666 RepID=UPI001CF2606B|nr:MULTISPECIES: poly-beta-hydroxybutyrate polymerase N-terminal domain-containing protein [unclassified Halomonas]MCA8864846.1 hypothetical protein [Halomonas sp. SBBP1]UZH11557.1 poly-beta-hydroxybutyrate polymerase N-terminal domain-containing protein [Halomonas sp. BDJS001]